MRCKAFIAERGPLFHSEPVLLIHYREPEIIERDPLLDQRVRADDDINVATRD